MIVVGYIFIVVVFVILLWMLLLLLVLLILLLINVFVVVVVSLCLWFLVADVVALPTSWRGEVRSCQALLWPGTCVGAAAAARLSI